MYIHIYHITFRIFLLLALLGRSFMYIYMKFLLIFSPTWGNIPRILLPSINLKQVQFFDLLVTLVFQIRKTMMNEEGLFCILEERVFYPSNVKFLDEK